MHNLLRYCVYFAKKIANHALSEVILQRGELGRITFDVGSRVQEYMRTSPPPTPNKYDKLHNLDFSTFSKLINCKNITGHGVILIIFHSNHVIRTGYLMIIMYIYALDRGRKYK